MYYIEKTFEISASHRLHLQYESKCQRMHGHNWRITVYCKSQELDDNGMVVDFSEVKRKVKMVLDHQDLNEVLPFNPTAENIARWITEQIPHCYKTSVQESEGNVAIYEVDE
ncbi:MAG: 6-carboxytetrahydropterin synthase QueD [Prevotella sp.]|nr:6-carboxytetrahydropterin synthase QueD [Prevotella sp.]MBR5062825.1 6-carboxytetrahydropterin synthase QueD [Prevotella sp.]